VPVKLLKSKWYIVNLDTLCVAIDYTYERFWTEVESERKRKRMRRFTAMTGKHIVAHAGHPWISPLTLEEAEKRYFDELISL